MRGCDQPVLWAPLRRKLHALLLVSLASAAAFAQDAPPAGGTQISAAQTRDAWLLVRQIESRERLRKRFFEAEALIGGSGLPADFWKEAHAALEALSAEKDAAKRPALTEEVDRQANKVIAAVVARTPPFAAMNNVNDDGSEVLLGWGGVEGAVKYEIERQNLTRADVRWRSLASVPARKPWELVSDRELIARGEEYKYRLSAISADGQVIRQLESDAVRPVGEWFHTRRVGLLTLVLIISGAIIYYIRLARRGVELKIRKIAGLEAVEEAVGRATEMGKPILFVPGIQDMNDIQTVAGVIILGRVARVAATHDAILEVPTSRSLVMTAARETVQANYLDAGRPDAYDEKKIYYTTDEQFGYVAAATGTMVREKPAACFYMGAFYAESLILAETGNMLGAIQVAGTAQPAQLPFFVAACDYTLIGEEFFAASAYLSGDPQQLGSLKGQDIGKIVAMIVLLFGILVATVVAVFTMEQSWVGDVQDWLINDLLDSKG